MDSTNWLPIRSISRHTAHWPLNNRLNTKSLPVSHWRRDYWSLVLGKAIWLADPITISASSATNGKAHGSITTTTCVENAFANIAQWSNRISTIPSSWPNALATHAFSTCVWPITKDGPKGYRNAGMPRIEPTPTSWSRWSRIMSCIAMTGWRWSRRQPSKQAPPSNSP